MDELRAPEAHFDFCRMHVHVDFVVRHLQKEQRRRKNGGWQNGPPPPLKPVPKFALPPHPPFRENVHDIWLLSRGVPPRSKTTLPPPLFLLPPPPPPSPS